MRALVRLLVASVAGLALLSTQPPSTGAAEGVVNGLDTAVLSGVVDNLKKHPEGGRVTFIARTEWQNGMRAFTTIGGFRMDGKMVHEGQRRFVLLGDESTELSGTDAAPGAVEELMYALGTCIVAAANANAALMGVKLSRLDVDIESDLDLHGLFALDPKVRAGVNTMRVKIAIAGNADEETLKKIANLGYQFSPVSETIRNGLKFTPAVTVAK